MSIVGIPLSVREDLVSLIKEGHGGTAAGRSLGLTPYQSSMIIRWARDRGSLPRQFVSRLPVAPTTQDILAEDLALLNIAISIGGDLRLRFKPFTLRQRAGLTELEDRGIHLTQRLIDRGWLKLSQRDCHMGPLAFVTDAGFAAAGHVPLWVGDHAETAVAAA